MTSSPTDTQRPRYPDTWNSRAGERRCQPGDPCDACLAEPIEAPQPAITDPEAELAMLILGRTATSAARAILLAGYAKPELPEATPCCGASEACRDCPTD